MQLRLWWVKCVGSCLLALVSATAGARQPGDTYGAGGGRQRAHAVGIGGGVLTIDGLTVRTDVDLRVASQHFVYIYVPGAGTALISTKPFGEAHEQKAAFRGNTLSVLAGGRRLQLSTPNRMRGTRSAYVRFDAGVGPHLRMPTVSYGDAATVPAIWPEDDVAFAVSRRRVKVKARRALRSARLCRPSPKGKELCALVHEVVYQH